MTKTKEELIKQINRLSGRDRTEELSKLPKYKICVIAEEVRDQNQEEELDLASRIGVSFNTHGDSLVHEWDSKFKYK